MSRCQFTTWCRATFRRELNARRPLLLALWLVAASARALEPNIALTQYAHDVWQRKDGLPASAVQCIAQTGDGYLWLGTPAGLVRFDGVRFTYFPTHPADPLRRETITALTMGADGALWIGTRADGLRRIEHGAVSLVSVGRADAAIRAIHFDRQGTMRIASSAGIYLLRGDGDPLPVAEIDSVASGMTTDRAGTVWAVSHGGVHRLDPAAVRSMPSPAVPETILVDRTDRIWLATFGGLYRRSAASFGEATGWEQLLTEHVRTLFEDKEGNVWVGSSEALTRFRPGAGSRLVPADRLAIRDVLTIMEDREGSLWIGTRNGLHRLKDVNVLPWTSSEGLPGDAARSVLESKDGSLYIFTSDLGVTQMTDRGLTAIPEVVDGPSCAAADGSIWIGTTGTLFHLRDGAVQRYGVKDGVPDKWIGSITEDGDGLILTLASFGGICRWSPTRGARPYVLANGTVFNVPFHVMTTHRARDGTLWMGGFDGLWCFRAGEITRYTTPEGISALQPWFDQHPDHETYSRTVVTSDLADRTITSMAEDDDGTLWFASNRGGLTRLRNGKFTAFTTSSGLFSNQLFCVLVDDDHDLWLSCPRGIFRVRADELEAVANHRATAVRCTVFTTDDGMKNEECVNDYQPAGIKRRDGTLWFATRMGIASINPRKLRTNPLPPPIVIEEIVVDGRSVGTSGLVTLPPGASKVEFRFAGLSLLAPERVRFRYQLKGYDGDWIEAGTSRAAYYTKLPPGNYEFLVTACNNDNVWNTSPARVPLRLRAYFHQTSWFYGLCGLGLGAGIFGAHRWRVRRLEANESELQRRVAKRTADLSHTNAELKREIAERERAEREVKTVQAELIQASRQAGMAEVATGVLHNVGNVLNSVNVSTSVALDHLRNSRTENVGKIAALLHEHSHDLPRFLAEDPRGRTVITYLTALGDLLVKEHQAIARDLADVRKHVDHLKEVVAMQQNYARLGGVLEPVPIREIIDDALQLNAAAFARHDITVVREITSEAVITTDRHKVLQIVVNLLRNAKHACDESERTDKCTTIRVRPAAAGIEIVVADNGVGIPRENLVRIFSHGFTTRKQGHGFGLHSAAIAAKELGGTLTADSAGPGQGATFRFTLPLVSPPTP